jgi:hypothetical protein
MDACGYCVGIYGFKNKYILSRNYDVAIGAESKAKV